MSQSANSKINQNFTLTQFQNLIGDIYAVPDDRQFSIFDLLANQERFAMRALKGIRKKDLQKTKSNLLIAFCWLNAIANRFHLDLEKSVWNRFPGVCSYCGNAPCRCRKIKLSKRVKIKRDELQKPSTFSQFQAMFEKIYPPKGRSLVDAGIHLAEETGEVNETISIYLGEHKKAQFEKISEELADWTSCMFGIANSAKINVEGELTKRFKNGCHTCHHTPCTCNFSFVANFES